MISEVAIPVMDQTTETVLLTRWLKQEGDAVRTGDAVCEIETDKATVEIEAGTEGVLRKTLVEPGTRIPPRTVVALVGPASDIVPDIDPDYNAQKTTPLLSNDNPVTTAHAVDSPTPAPAPTREIRISPRARRLAETHQVDLASIAGSGPDGRIIEDDVKAAIEHKNQVAATGGGTDARVARAKAERVSLSWRTIPHFHMEVTVDLSQIVSRKSAAGSRVTFTDFFALALAQTLPHHPVLNGHWQNDAQALTMIPAIRLGLLVQTDRGLVIPALRDLRGRSLADIAAEREQLVNQAHAGTLTATALQEPTFTLSNVGPGHIDTFTAIISPPQVAILSVGSIQQRPLVVNAELVIRPAATFTLGVDHRAVDGRQAAAFLEQLKTNLES
ncbi:MAG: 2-oxo acid dehydrogenase subunit E2 [Chloroflexi bacterium]|nr:2-oxo acid dehydrogenase subunit E2 [Chloroflexota bacterium]